MKKFWYAVVSLILCIGLFGSVFALANQFDTQPSTNIPNGSEVESSGDTGNESPDDTGSEEPDDTGSETPIEKVIYTGQFCSDITELSAGDKIIIVALGYNVALSTEQNASNRGVADVTKGEQITFSDDVQVIVLEEGHLENTFALKTSTGYLYAPSSSSNQLKTRDEANNDNALWSINFGSSGTANIVAQGTSTRNVLRYNSKSKLFSCYESTETQEPVVIYKLVESEEN